MRDLKRTLLNLGFAGVVGSLTASSTLAAPASRTLDPGFKVYDSNGDGTVSAEEFRAQGGLEAAFRDGDANNDGRLNADELVKAKAGSDPSTANKFVDDAWITAKVKTLLLKDEGVRGLDVKVQTHKGMVLLSGWVSDASQIPRAAEIARGVEGVKGVGNDLRIKP